MNEISFMKNIEKAVTNLSESQTIDEEKVKELNRKHYGNYYEKDWKQCVRFLL